MEEQHDAHWKDFLDFWCEQLERKVRSYIRKDERRGKEDQRDREEGDLYA